MASLSEWQNCESEYVPVQRTIQTRWRTPRNGCAKFAQLNGVQWSDMVVPALRSASETMDSAESTRTKRLLTQKNQPKQIKTSQPQGSDQCPEKSTIAQESSPMINQPGRIALSITTCPKCKARVIPKAEGTWPSCQAKISW
jgi:hypothetical protein